MSDITRLKGFFFAYFAYVGIVSPYLSLYLSDTGFTIAQIGVLLSLPQWIRVIAPPFWGWLADRGGHSHRLMRISCVLTLFVVLALPVMTGLGFTATAVTLAALFFVSAAQMPIGEARTLALTRGDAAAYGNIRLWGSIGFVGGVALVGPALDRFGTTSLTNFMALGVALLIGFVWAMPAEAGSSGVRQASLRLRDRLREAPVAAFFAANFLMLFAHASYYVLFSLYLESQGYSKAAIGLIWTLGVVAEVVLFRWQGMLFARARPLVLLTISIAIAAFRFAIIGASGGNLTVLLAAQVLHAFTFGLHHSAVMKVLHQWFEPRQQARAQALYITIGYGLGGAIGGLVVSALWVHVSPAAAFYGSALAAALGCVAMAVCFRLPPSASA